MNNLTPMLQSLNLEEQGIYLDSLSEIFGPAMSYSTVAIENL